MGSGPQAGGEEAGEEAAVVVQMRDKEHECIALNVTKIGQC